MTEENKRIDLIDIGNNLKEITQQLPKIQERIENIEKELDIIKNLIKEISKHFVYNEIPTMPKTHSFVRKPGSTFTEYATTSKEIPEPPTNTPPKGYRSGSGIK